MMDDIPYSKHLRQEQNYDFLIKFYQKFFLVYLQKNEERQEQEYWERKILKVCQKTKTSKIKN